MSSLGSNELFTNALEEKVVKLADNIKTLQQVVKDAESRAKLSEEKVADLTVELATTEKQKEAAIASVSSLQAHVESEKKSSETEIKEKVDEIKELEKDSKTQLEALKKKGEASVTALELKITGLKEELKNSQEECTKSNNLCEELKKKVIDFEKKVKIETDARKNAEIVGAEIIAKLETDTAKELADLSALKKKELNESAVSFKNLEELYNKQTQLLTEKEDVIATYEDERGSLPKIVKLGLSVAGEQTKESVKNVRGRSRNLARGASEKGGKLLRGARSRSRGLTRGMRSKSRAKIRSEVGESAERQPNEEKVETEKETEKAPVEKMSATITKPTKADPVTIKTETISETTETVVTPAPIAVCVE